MDEEKGRINQAKEFLQNLSNNMVLKPESIKQILKQYLEGISEEEKINFYINCFNNIKNLDLIYIIVDSLNTKELCELIIRDREFMNRNNPNGIAIMKNIVEKLPVQEIVKNVEDIERLPKKLEAVVLTRLPEDLIIEYLQKNPYEAFIACLENFSNHDKYDELISGINDEKAKVFVMRMISGAQRLEKFEDEKNFCKSLASQHITILNNEDDEIKRLDSATDIRELLLYGAKTSKNAIIKWTEKNPQGTVLLNSIEDFEHCFARANNEYEKAIMAIAFSGKSEDKLKYYKYIKDDFCRMKITDEKIDSPYGFKRHTIEKIKDYQQICEKLQEYKEEQPKTEYIKNLQDNDMKISLLENIKNPSNREKIINSLSREVDPEIENVDNETQNMIYEFINDHYKGKIPQEKMEILLTVFRRTNCEFGKIFTKNAKGLADSINHRITIKEDIKKNKELVRGCLLHEYAHMLSYSRFKQTGVEIDKKIEEGNADLFADMVVTHYYQKHNIPRDKRYYIITLYDKENAYARTLLYPLQAQGKDIDTMMEYMLGSKEKYFEQTLSPEKTQKMHRNEAGQIDAKDLTFEDIYQCHKGQYKRQKDSIYLKRNKKIEEFMNRDDKSASLERTVTNVVNAIKSISIKDLAKFALGKNNVTMKEIREAEQVLNRERTNQREDEIANEK